jgi:hypothetical protein
MWLLACAISTVGSLIVLALAYFLAGLPRPCPGRSMDQANIAVSSRGAAWTGWRYNLE